MPFIRVTYPAGAMTQAQKDALAPLLVDAVMRQEVEPVTAAARQVTALSFHEVPAGDWYVAGRRDDDRPLWLVENIVAAGFFDQARRDAAQRDIGCAFASLFDDGAKADVNGELVSPAMLLRVYSVFVEVPEGHWGVLGRTVSALEISSYIGNRDWSPRDRELRANLAQVGYRRAA